MLKVVFAAGLGAMMAGLPLAALADTAEPMAAAGANQVKHHTPTGSYRSQMRHPRNLSKEQARAGAEHMRKMSQ
jgi:hypothetical protein